RSLMIVEELGDKLLRLGVSDLAEELRRLGHRYPEVRARYIVEAREKLREIVDAVHRIEDEFRLREWLVENVKGFGLKEASHFLRNIGFKNLAIIDLHILRVLRRYGLIEEFRSLTRRRYLEVEKLLRGVAERLGISVAELDLYLWYMDSGRILK
ncbi:MAG: N-glycosylase, partial [Thaumarchaeota archaeon]